MSEGALWSCGDPTRAATPQPRPGRRGPSAAPAPDAEDAPRTQRSAPGHSLPWPAPAAADTSPGGRRGRSARSATCAAAETRGAPPRPRPRPRAEGVRHAGGWGCALWSAQPSHTGQGTCPAAGQHGWAWDKDGDATGQSAGRSWFAKAGLDGGWDPEKRKWGFLQNLGEVGRSLPRRAEGGAEVHSGPRIMRAGGDRGE